MAHASRFRFIVKLAAAVAIAAAQGACGAATAAVVEGVVRYVIDGDTLVLLPDAPAGPPIRLRLRGIDAPEICQSGGVEARDAIAQRVLGRRVRASGTIDDDYGRRLATVSVDGEDLGAWMVAQGHAWSARYRGRPGPYAREEREARAARRGVFAHDDPQPPRSFRRAHGSCHPSPAP